MGTCCLPFLRISVVFESVIELRFAGSGRKKHQRQVWCCLEAEGPRAKGGEGHSEPQGSGFEATKGLNFLAVGFQYLPDMDLRKGWPQTWVA